MRYFFDLREDNHVACDDEGVEFASFELAEREAVLSLAEMAREFVRTHGTCGAAHTMAIHVRDTHGPVIKAQFVFEIGRADN